MPSSTVMRPQGIARGLHRVVGSVAGPIFLLPASSRTHAVLVKSIPASRAVLVRPPVHVQLWFNERVEAGCARVSVWDAEGKQGNSGDMQDDRHGAKRFSGAVQQLTPERDTMKYRGLAGDGHLREHACSLTLRTRP